MIKFTKIIDRYKKLDNKKRGYMLALIVVTLITLVSFISSSMITGSFNRMQLKNAQDEQKVDAVGIIITETKDGNKYFEIYGETGHYSNDHSIATLHNVIGNCYKDNKVAMSFQSSKGTYNEKTGTITLFENTFIVLDDGTSLNADKLTWSGSNKDTVAEGNVVIKRNNEMSAFADKGIICAGYDKFKIIGNTKSNVYEKNNKTNRG